MSTRILIVPTLNKEGYWITVDGMNIYDSNLRLGLERQSEYLERKVKRLKAEIVELEDIRQEVDSKLESLGGKYRPRRVLLPDSHPYKFGDSSFKECSECKNYTHVCNLTAIEIAVGEVKVFCPKCFKESKYNDE